MQLVSSKFVTSNVICSIVSTVFFIVIGKRLSHYISRSSSTFQNLAPVLKKEWHCRNLSTLHAILVCLLIPLVVIVDKNELRDPLWGTSWKSEAIVSLTVGYIASDILYLLSSSPSSTDAYWTSFAHHFLVLLSYSTVAARGAMVYVALCRLFAEISTPFVNMRWMLDICGMKSSTLYLYNGWMMLITFFFSRILAMPYCYYVILTANDPSGFESLKGFIIYYIISAMIVDCLNVYWFYRMVKGAIKYYYKKNE